MGRPKFDFRTNSKETYNKFIENNPNIEISFEDYQKVIYKYNSLIANHILETGNKIKMPFGLGELTIVKYKPKRFLKTKQGKEIINLPVNWQESRLQGKKIYMLNSHTEGYKYYWMWNYWTARLRFSSIWKFQVSRINSRLLGAYLKLPDGKYKDIYKQYARIK